MFIGDSFTHNGKWTHETIKTLNKKISVEGFSLGADGFSTIQSYIKLKKHFDEIKPDLVILLFCGTICVTTDKPGIMYSPKLKVGLI